MVRRPVTDHAEQDPRGVLVTRHLHCFAFKICRDEGCLLLREKLDHTEQGGEKQTSRTAKGPQAEGPRGHRQNGQGAASRRAKSPTAEGPQEREGNAARMGSEREPPEGRGDRSPACASAPRPEERCNKRQTLFDDLIGRGLP